MIALGQLAGGIAHDFNNTLQAVAGNAELIGRRPNNPGEVRRLAAWCWKPPNGEARSAAACWRSRDGMRSTRAGGSGSVVDRHARVNAENTWALNRGSGDRRGRVAMVSRRSAAARNSAAEPGVQCSGCHADGGDVILSAASETVTSSGDQPQLKPGDYLRLSVTDNGIGMDSGGARARCRTVFHNKTQRPRHRAWAVDGQRLRGTVGGRAGNHQRAGPRHGRDTLAAAD